MPYTPQDHLLNTKTLAQALTKADIYRWLVTRGYFPETYVLPPCFWVSKYPPRMSQVYRVVAGGRYRPPLTEYLEVHFPKTEFTDRTFGIIHPDIHSDIAAIIAWNWTALCRVLFHPDNRVCSYSFPIPLDSQHPGQLGTLRAGRMIYEFIEMAENDLAAIAYKYRYVFRTDIKNFYPSIYTHSIPWAIHGKTRIRRPANRNNYRAFFGNRLDKLFQNANDGCTNGIPIGPVVSDIIAEIIASAVDRLFSKDLPDDVVVVRFKDDYRILTKTEAAGRDAIKALQGALKAFRLELNDDKTELTRLPDGLFRKWVSEYHAVNPRSKSFYKFRRFREVFLSVIEIDRRNPGCGVIDRFLADIVTRNYRLRVEMNRRTLPKVISLLLMLGDRRTKAFPKVLAIIEAILQTPFGVTERPAIVSFLAEYLDKLVVREMDNRYLIAWIYYFLKANRLDALLNRNYNFTDPIVRATKTSRFSHFGRLTRFKIYDGVIASAQRVSLLSHLDVFKPQ